jgi:S1-C subfamily serine protease
VVAAVVAGLVLMLVIATGAFLAGRALSHAAQAPTLGRQSDGSGTGQIGPDNQTGPGNTSTGGPTDPQVAAIAAKVNPALVDITTTLGYQNAKAAGTGIVLGSDGVILTNNHVVAGATSISVYDVGNGRTYAATVVGYDRSDDLAIVKLTGASGLTTAVLGDSSTVRVGDAIVGIGNAGGTGGTPTAVGGTVTALDRTIVAQDESGGASEQLTGLIQVAADIQAGDSGGSLVNSSGQVIGVDTAASAQFRYQQTGGEGYAIPINKAMTVAKQIEAGQASGTVHIGATGFLGVGISAGHGSGSAVGGAAGGAVVTQVQTGSPAAAAGLAAGDTIQSVDGATVDSPNTLTGLLDRHHPGDRVSIGWLDGTGQSHTATVTLATGPVG